LRGLNVFFAHPSPALSVGSAGVNRSMIVPEQTEAETILTIVGAVLCLSGWLLVYLGTRLAGISAGLAAGLVAGQVLIGLMEVPAGQSGWWLIASGVVGAFGGLFLVGMAARIAFGLAGLLIGALLGDAIAAGQLAAPSVEASLRQKGQVTWVASGTHTVRDTRGQVWHGGGQAAPARPAREWTQQRIQAVAAGGFLGAVIGVLAQKLFVIAITAYLGAALLHAGLPSLRANPGYLPYLLGLSVLIQGGLAWKFLKKAVVG
jgi:hypothetical protein